MHGVAQGVLLLKRVSTDHWETQMQSPDRIFVCEVCKSPLKDVGAVYCSEKCREVAWQYAEQLTLPFFKQGQSEKT